MTVVDKNVDRKGTRAVAQAYLEYLYTDEGQDIAGKNFYRPISPKAQIVTRLSLGNCLAYLAWALGEIGR